jgi:hypothetical protein
VRDVKLRLSARCAVGFVDDAHTAAELFEYAVVGDFLDESTSPQLDYSLGLVR